jgi:hypothetical protein
MITRVTRATRVTRSQVASKAPRFVARGRGQVMVLGAVALLVMALMLMASFSVTNAIHERIRIQSHADAEAYSLAVLEARGLNVTAHYNRAIAADLVAQMSLHSWMAIASNNVDQLMAGMIAMTAVMAYETMLGCIYPNIPHCPCVAFAFFNGMVFYMSYLDWAQKVQDLETKFNDAVKQLKDGADALYKAEQAAIDATFKQLDVNGSVLASLKATNAPVSTYAAKLMDQNRADYACVFEGSNHDGECGGPRQRDKSDANTKSVVMQNAANAARPMFDITELASLVSPAQWDQTGSNDNVPKGKLMTGNWYLVAETTRAFVGKENHTDPADQVKSTGFSTVLVTNYLDTPMAPGFGAADIYSESGGGGHTPSDVHSGNHGEFKGVWMDDPCGQSNCFVNFRALADPKKDFGQPTVFGGVSQSLRVFNTRTGGFQQSAPWELNAQGKVSVELVPGSPAEVNYLARGDGHAVAKAKVYFHQMGDWSVAPNLFDPFWRAKLHPFSAAEFKDVLDAVGDADGKKLVEAGAPVEGEL